jgi:hypothetical protein
MKVGLRAIIYWCGLTIALICEIAALTILVAIFRNRFSDYSDAWMAIWFFGVMGGVAWIVGSAAAR